MSKPVLFLLLAVAIAAGWSFFGGRIAPTLGAWMESIEPTGFSDQRGNSDELTDRAARASSARADGPQREHIRDRVRRKVEADLERGARRNGP